MRKTCDLVSKHTKSPFLLHFLFTLLRFLRDHGYTYDPALEQAAIRSLSVPALSFPNRVVVHPVRALLAQHRVRRAVAARARVDFRCGVRAVALRARRVPVFRGGEERE